ncbi:TonB-dependent outer membrane protein, SusC/RagA [Gemmatirosa kalamazoonensis]|uniref:TonB-dependent outer membrane protein, SusC/RagA n=1 Tax=Gemmatirosa kalamazoonensis TaxID=861299 RepID=W0RHG3_9BACT|nr:SusC/RagA family TonB-linked outer membrane protein [Gemmatirosa kalamazoonensis]AHG89760.1 TonB-dependent outer membrane protein, SusC/RagA [Gemmatirosa kalamazoonensis]
MRRCIRAWAFGLIAGQAALASGARAVQAQPQPTAVVRGSVVDSATRQPIPNAQIVVGSTARGQTDAAGRFLLRSVPAGTVTIRAQRIGFQPRSRQVTLVAGSTADVDFVLRAQAAIMSDVVVVGYGTRSRAEVSSAVAQVGGENVRNTPVAGVDAALQGKAPGVQVTQNAGNPGNGITVRIRGASSISASNQPLYVVDGVPMIQDNVSQIGFGGQGITAVTGLNPDEIDRIDVLKDAAAAAIYGSRASNGVVMITTKRGNASAPRFSFDVYYGGQKSARRLPLLNAKEYVAFMNEAAKNDDEDPADFGFTPGVDDTTNTDWQSAVLRRAPVSNFNLTANGGGDRFSYIISGSRFGQDGIVMGSGYNRGSGRVNVDLTATPKLTFRSSVAVSREHFDRTENDNTIVGAQANSQANQPNVPIYKPGTTEFSTSSEGLAYANPVAIATFNKAPANTLRALGNIEAAFEATSRLRINGRVGADVYDYQERRWDSPRVIDTYAVGAQGVARQANTTASKYVGEAFADLDALRSNAQKLTVTVGTGTEFNHNEILYLRGEGFGNDQFQYPGTAGKIVNYDGQATQANLLSAFTRANYSLKDRYLLTASLRTDGSSRFGKSRRWGVFPAASLGWNLSDERFLSGLRRFATAKLRASYGTTGNQSIPTLYGYLTSYARANYGSTAGIAPAALGNEDLRWESTRESDIGLDLSFLDGRVSVIADYYSKNTTDLLVSRPVPTTSGFASIWDNVGSVKNAGAELQLTTVNFRSKGRGGFDWTTDVNLSHNANKVTALYQDQPFASGIGGVNYVAIGQPIGVFFTQKFVGVDPQTGDAQYQKKDGTITKSPVSADRQYVGSPHPKYFGGVRNTMTWRNLDLNVFVQFSQGAKVFDLFREYSDDSGYNYDNKISNVLKRWQKPGDVTDVPRASFDGTSGAQIVSSRYVEDGSYVRLQDVTFGVRLPSALMSHTGVSNARLYVAGSNLKLWTKYLGYDPDVNSNGSNANISLGQDFYAYPRARTISVGLSGNF